MKYIKRIICKLFKIKQCQCPIEINIDHCEEHSRFKKSCDNCKKITKQFLSEGI